MGKPVNLNRYRKEKVRAEKKARADANAVQHGRTKAEKTVVKLQQDQRRRDLDGHKVNE